jgi:hypothetical protein
LNSESDPFAGWEMASVGCYWSRALPDGRMVHMSSWASGSRSGYALTVDFVECVFPGLDEAKAAYEFLATAGRRASVIDAPGAMIQ